MNDLRSDRGPGGLPLYDSGLALARLQLGAGADFWAEIQRLADAATLDTRVDEIVHGRPAPRVWSILDDAGNASRAAVAALTIARSLAGQGRAVIVVDTDDRRAQLTRWTGRGELEGWIDLVRYSVSTSFCSMSLPFAGTRSQFVGVGSFYPTQVNAAEIEWVVTNLSRRADDVILVAPVDAAGVAWTRNANIRLLCWDQLQRTRSVTTIVSGEMARAGCPVHGLIGFGMAEADLVDTRLTPLPVPAGFEVETPSLLASGAGEADAFAEPEAIAALPAAQPLDTEIGKDCVNVDWDDNRPYRRRIDFLWGWLGVLLICIAAAVGIYLIKGGDYVADSDQTLAPFLPSTTVSADRTAPLTQQPDTVQTKAVTSNPSSRSDRPSTSFDVPVGRDGWALHIASFRNADDAAREMRDIESRGFHTIVQPYVLPDKGRWYRVYVGSFSSRSAASAARPKVMRELGTGWADPTEF